jgi:peptidoglycan/LPS O-acetylase OafA/YrhL
MAAKRDDLLTVQALRAIAALLVVAYHAVDQWGTHAAGLASDSLWPNGSAGVDIFFVISGLVMTISARRVAPQPQAWRIFLRQRLARIMPLYWLATTAKIVAVLALPMLATRTRLDPLYVGASYVLWPVHDLTGQIRPVLPVGWTLSYEMMFYLLIVAALAARLPIGRVVFPALAAFAAAGWLMPDGGFLSTIVLEFLFGLAIGAALQRGMRLPAPLAAPLLVAGLVAILLVPAESSAARPLTRGVPAACIVAASVSLEPVLARHLPRWLLAAGDASYATYLTHGFVVPLVFLIATRTGLSGWPELGLVVVAGLVASALVGQVTHAWVERPMMRWFRRRPPIPIIAVAG